MSTGLLVACIVIVFADLGVEWHNHEMVRVTSILLLVLLVLALWV